MGSSSVPNIVGACRQDNVVVGRRVVEERAYTVEEWRDFVGQKSLSCGVQRKVGAEIAKKTWCYSCVTWRRRKSTDETFVLLGTNDRTQINAKFHGVTCGIGRDRARKVNKRVLFLPKKKRRHVKRQALLSGKWLTFYKRG